MGDAHSIHQQALALATAAVREDVDGLNALVDDLDADAARAVAYGLACVLGAGVREIAQALAVDVDAVIETLRGMILDAASEAAG